jgi:hypothetical protein
MLPVLPVILAGHAEQKPWALPGPIRQKATKGTKIKTTALRAEFITTKYSNNLNPVPPKVVPRKHSGFVYSEGLRFKPRRFFFDLLFPSVPKKASLGMQSQSRDNEFNEFALLMPCKSLAFRL